MKQHEEQLIAGMENSLSITVEEILMIARTLRAEGLSEEAIVRQLIQRLSQLTDQPLSREQEDKIVDMLLFGPTSSD